MSTDLNDTGKLAFSTRCLPGSVAEQQEKERMEAFQRAKAERKAEEARSKPEKDAQRQQKYQAACEANRERMRRGKAASMPPGYLRP
jgi:sRNA-binding protein